MKDAFKVKKGLNVQPTDPADVVNPEAGDIIVDSTDDNRLKVYDPTSSEFAAVGTGGSSGNILSDIEKLTPTVSNVVAVTDTTVFLPIDDNNKSVKATFSGSDGTIRYEAPASADLDGVQGVVKVWIKTALTNLSLVATKDGVAQNTGLTINSTNKWRQYEIPVVLGDANYGFEIQASGAVSGDVYIDESVVKVERVLQQFDTTITDWVEFTPVLKGFTSDPSLGSTSVNRAYYRRVGDSLEFRAEIQQTSAGSPGSGNYYFELPNNLQADLDKIQASATTGLGTVGSASARIASGNYEGTASVINNNGVSIYIGNAGTNTSYVGSSYLSTSNSEWRLSFEATIPIQGWSSETSTIVTQDTELTAKTANEFSAIVTIGGNVLTQNYDWLTCSPPVGSVYNCNFNAGLFTTYPTCSYTPNGSSSNGGRITSASATSISIYTVADTQFHLKCTKHRNDYNKSATIVGKFENINSSDLCHVEARDVSSATSITAGLPIPFVEVKDNCNTWNGDEFRPTKTGWYKVRGSVRASAAVLQYMDSRINNVDKNLITTDPIASSYVNFGDLVYLTVGDVYHVRSESTFTTVINSARTHWISIQEMPDYEAIVKNLSDQKVKCQTKYLSANAGSNGVVSDLTFNNLTVGKKYKAYMQTRYYIPASVDTIETYIDNGSQRVCYTIASLGTLGEIMFLTCKNDLFIASASSMTFSINAMNAGNFIQGLNSKSGTSVTLCELPDTYVETTEF